ncbi:hypothetical protein DUNSADRAFT_8355 [Dunaliella salina]|uniref:Flavin-containing monooxygenase n=1 Tax=Dunaliella salina TaxID=3046 RepID=A0ABQ7GJT2_DUNSA|nr:hypothetical protein DUNSADRAFT_8355 [Dunaliella salina]|eukprot:KAF5834854.1 hypothetical protein DUNSADRAFT_8355 [Dunaliella salina]
MTVSMSALSQCLSRRCTTVQGRTARTMVGQPSSGVALRTAATKHPPNAEQPPVAKRVAIVGGGAGGLVVLREFLRENHDALCFEQGNDVGGVWRYSKATDTDPLGKDPHRTVVHTSMYKGLRTNLPRQIMGFSDFPMDPEGRAMQMAASAPGAGAPSSARTPAVGEDSKVSSSQSAATHARAHDDGGVAEGCTSLDSRIYPRHEEVQNYLRAFAAWFGLHKAVRCNTRVLSARPIFAPPHEEQHKPMQQTAPGSSASDGHGSLDTTRGVRWLLEVESHAADTSASDTEAQQHSPRQHGVEQHEFDALVVCNGHYTEPNLPEVPGMDVSPVFQMHSHNYRSPDQFKGQVVLVVGNSNSGDDISKELSAVAKTVHLCARAYTARSPPPPGSMFPNVIRRPMVSGLTEDGRALFPDGLEEHIDAVVYCTGYRYAFPFLPGTTHQEPSAEQSNGQKAQQYQQGAHANGSGPSPVSDISQFVVSEGHHVQPLYKHMFPPALAPSLSFVGLPWKIVPFPQMELQGKLIARVLSGRAQLPSPEVMSAEARQHLEGLRQAGIPLRFAHMQNLEQFAYNDELAEMCGDVEKLPSWRQAMYLAAGMNKRGCPESYRDVWTEEALLKEAEQDFAPKLRAMEDTLKCLRGSQSTSQHYSVGR